MSNDKISYSIFVRLGDDGRTEGDARRAVRFYLSALVQGGSRDRYIKHMLGVTYSMLGDLVEATYWLNEAAKEDRTSNVGNVFRDLAEVHRKFGYYSLASEYLELSLLALHEAQDLPQIMMTLGFKARLLMEMGEFGQALHLFEATDAMNRYGDNRHYELYNALAYAHALSYTGRHYESRRVALRALRLARECGGLKHRVRAWSLLICGYRLDDLTRRLVRK